MILTVFSTSVLLVGPKLDKSHLEDKHLQYGKFATLNCNLEDGDFPLTFVWTKDGQLATSLPDIQVVNQKFSSLMTISAASSVHSGMYICKASNPASWATMTVKIFVNGTFEL